MRRRVEIRKRGRSSGIAFQVLLCFGFVWLAAFGLVVGWYLGTNEKVKQRFAHEVHSIGTPQRIRGNAGQTMEEEINVPILSHHEVMKFYEDHKNNNDPDAFRSPILVFTCRRPEYLSQTLEDILRISDHCGFGCPVIVSEDGKILACFSFGNVLLCDGS